MKCFNHVEREAVATCQNCGKGLCKECAAKHRPCLCDDCYEAIQTNHRQAELSKEEQRRQRYRNALVDTRSEFIKVLLLGVVVGAICLYLCVSSKPRSFVDMVVFFLMGFVVPFGWKLLTYVQSFFPVTIFGTFAFWAVWCVVKFFLSMAVGGPAFIYQLIKTISAQSKISKMD